MGFHVGKYTIHGCYGVYKIYQLIGSEPLIIKNICMVRLTYFQDFHTKSGFQVQESRICELCTLHKINISHLGKGKLIFKTALERDMLVPRRVYTSFFYGSIHKSRAGRLVGRLAPETIQPRHMGKIQLKDLGLSRMNPKPPGPETTLIWLIFMVKSWFSCRYIYHTWLVVFHQRPSWWFFTNASEKICARQIGFIFPKYVGVKIKTYVRNHHLVYAQCIYTYTQCAYQSILQSIINHT